MRYVYGMRERGYGEGNQPIEGFVEKMEDPTEAFWDLLIYERELSEKEIKEYDLRYLGKYKGE
jgi:hypothetical protein